MYVYILSLSATAFNSRESVRRPACRSQLRQIVKGTRKSLSKLFFVILHPVVKRGLSAKKREVSRGGRLTIENWLRVYFEISVVKDSRSDGTGRVARSSYKEARSAEAKPIWMQRERSANEYVQPRTWSERQMQVERRGREMGRGERYMC